MLNCQLCQTHQARFHHKSDRLGRRCCSRGSTAPGCEQNHTNSHFFFLDPGTKRITCRYWVISVDTFKVRNNYKTGLFRDTTTPLPSVSHLDLSLTFCKVLCSSVKVLHSQVVAAQASPADSDCHKIQPPDFVTHISTKVDRPITSPADRQHRCEV